ncbi:MAG TPA: carboxypeptidase-like regulatory domain-containing protein, partial [bacterium]|nr:carboxypeptidase-like regulatory domain-containing protein [bacterium]
MKKGIHRVLLVLGCVLVLVSSGIAATVDGHAYKFGESDHSGITIDLEPVTTTPTLSGLGVSLLLAGMTFLIFRKRIPGLVSPMVICLVGGLHCMVYAGYLATMETNAAGEYDFANVEPGDYSIHASAPGFYPESISNFTVTDGANTVPDIILYPMEAGDLISTDPIIGNMRYVPGGTFTQG